MSKPTIYKVKYSIAYTRAERAWFRRPLRALALAASLALGGHVADANPAPHAPALVAAQGKVSAAKRALTDARAAVKSERERESDARKITRRAAKIARLRAVLAKLESASPEGK